MCFKAGMNPEVYFFDVDQIRKIHNVVGQGKQIEMVQGEHRFSMRVDRINLNMGNNGKWNVSTMERPPLEITYDVDET